MLIGLNLLHANIGIGGGWNYIKGLVSALGEYDKANKYIGYCTDESECLVPVKTNFSKKKVKFSGTNRIMRIIYENTVLPILAKNDGIDCLHWFANTLGFFCPVFSVVTIADMLMYERPKSFSAIHQVYLRAMLPRTVKTADILAPISQSTANAVASILNGDLARMVVIPPIISEEFRPVSYEQTEVFRAKYRLPNKFWLYVAHYHPYKNHSRLFRAYAQMKTVETNYWPLVLRGEKNGAENEIKRLLNETGIAEDTIWLPRLGNEEMPLLYSSASALVFPSTYEGAGIPVMEAMACGCPVTASRIPTNIEFAGDAAMLFDPHRIEMITDALLRVGRDRELRERYRQLGLKKVEGLRPRRIAELTVSCYQKACRNMLTNNNI